MADPTNLTDSQFLSQDPEVLGLQRQRQLANLLTGQAFNAPQAQMISGHLVKPSALQQALPMINAAIGGATGARLDTEQQKIAEMLRTKGDAAVKQVMQDYNQNPQLGLQTASSLSQYPQVKALLPQLSKVAISEPTSDVQNFQYGQKNPEFNQYQTGLRKAGATNLAVHTGNALGSEFGKGIGAEDLALRNSAKNAELTAQNADQALKNLDKAITGPNADVRLQAAKYLNVAGANNTATIKASEEAFAQRSQALLGRVKSSGLAGSQGLTEGERKFLTNAYGGNLNLDKESLKGMLTLEKKLAHRDATMWNQRIKEMPPEVIKGTGVGPVTIPDIGEVDANNPLLNPKR